MKAELDICNNKVIYLAILDKEDGFVIIPLYEDDYSLILYKEQWFIQLLDKQEYEPIPLGMVAKTPEEAAELLIQSIRKLADEELIRFKQIF